MKTKPTKCGFDPQPYKGQPIGMFHCPECGQMVLAGVEHPDSIDDDNDKQAPATSNKRSCNYCLSKDRQECGGTEQERIDFSCPEHITDAEIKAYKIEYEMLLNQAYSKSGCYDIRFA
jgi:hypothetical protein